MRRSGERSQSGCSGGGKSRAAWTTFNTESNRKEDEAEGEKSNAKHEKKRETYGTIKGCILWCCMRAT